MFGIHLSHIISKQARICGRNICANVQIQLGHSVSASTRIYFWQSQKRADICCAGRHIETFHFGSNNGLQLADLLGAYLNYFVEGPVPTLLGHRGRNPLTGIRIVVSASLKVQISIIHVVRSNKSSKCEFRDKILLLDEKHPYRDQSNLNTTSTSLSVSGSANSYPSSSYSFLQFPSSSSYQ